MSNQLKTTFTWKKQSILLIILLISNFFPFYVGIIVFSLIFFIIGMNNFYQSSYIGVNKNMLFLWGFVSYSFIVSLIFKNNWGIFISIVYFFGLIFFNYYQENVRLSFLEIISNISLIASLILCIYALFEHLEIIAEWDYTFFSEKFNRGHPNRVEATFFNPNYYVMMLEFFIIIGVYKLSKAKKRIHKLMYLLVILFNVVVIFFTGNRTAPFVVLGSIVVFYFILGHKKISIGILLAVGMGILTLFYTGNFPRMDSIIGALGDRMNIWQTAISGIKDNFIFGRGPLTYRHVYWIYDGYETYHAHSLYLDTLLSYGIVGVSILIYPLVQYLKLLGKMKYYKRLRYLRALIWALIAIVLIHGITDHNIFWFQTALLFLLITLIVPNAIKKVENEKNI